MFIFGSVESIHLYFWMSVSLSLSLFPYPSVSFVYTGKTYTYVLSPSIYVWNHQFNSFICICSIFIHSFFHPPIHPSICLYAHLPVYWSTCLYNLLHFRYIPFFPDPTQCYKVQSVYMFSQCLFRCMHHAIPDWIGSHHPVQRIYGVFMLQDNITL